MGTSVLTLILLPLRAGRFVAAPLIVRPTSRLGGRADAFVDKLQFQITSGGVANDSQGVVAKQAFNLRITAQNGLGATDTNLNGDVAFTLAGINATLGESAPSTVYFSAGVTNASVTIVLASGTESNPSSQCKIFVGDDSSATDFYPWVYWKVTMDVERWKNCGFTGCTYNSNGCANPNGSYYCTVASGCGPGCTTSNKNQPQGYSSQTAFVALPYAGLCGTGIVLEASHGSSWSFLTSTTVGDIGPGSKTDDYWFTGGIPTMGGCLSDLLASNTGISKGCNPGPYGQATVLWRFNR
jgi:hypothetical protein